MITPCILMVVVFKVPLNANVWPIAGNPLLPICFPVRALGLLTNGFKPVQ
ncbi:hypothetical protein R2083_02480 [Nitrosomonas sp. Is35]|nr:MULTISPECIES: hypothetical protein [unclassified Nitrosomonas]MDV6340627.1 hypothetical protein [Nitrosomonas sp. Is24]MDV6346384.1 hypothetical protein [Nitrosomonas sp. Is35]